MAQLAQRVHVVQRRPEAASRRPPTAEAQKARTRASQAHPAAAVAARVALPVSQAVGARRRDAESASPAGLPPRLRGGVEALSGLAMDDVRVHRDSAEPARLGALAFTRGADIHLGPGQEQHLAHEAWHVVQQKQGRVTATAQLKSVAVNEDGALEAEADRMGAAALAAPSASGRATRSAAAGGAVVQAKVKDKDGVGWLDEKHPKFDQMSATLRAHIGKAESYMLRDDYHDKYGVEPLHLMEMSRKFLIGELHGAPADLNWTKETKDWSKVGKMFEAEKALPAQDRRDVGLPTAVDPQNQPLEDLHAYVFESVLEVLMDLKVLQQSWVRDYWDDARFKTLLLDQIARTKSNMQQAGHSFSTYEKFLFAYQKAPNTTERSKKIYYFSVRFHDQWQNPFKDLFKRLTDAAGFVTERKGRQFHAALRDIAAALPFLQDMARALVEIMEIADPAEKAALLKLTNTPKASPKVLPVVAADPMRERGMAANVGAAAAPLLVQIGNAHLPGVKALVGDTVVPVPRGTSLEVHTKKP